eukprot:3174346-Rhodomonas_salina.3
MSVPDAASEYAARMGTRTSVPASFCPGATACRVNTGHRMPRTGGVITWSGVAVRFQAQCLCSSQERGASEWSHVTADDDSVAVRAVRWFAMPCQIIERRRGPVAKEGECAVDHDVRGRIAFPTTPFSPPPPPPPPPPPASACLTASPSHHHHHHHRMLCMSFEC